MVRWMCGVATKGQANPQDLVERMQHDDLTKELHTHPVRWHEDVERQDGWLKKI